MPLARLRNVSRVYHRSLIDRGVRTPLLVLLIASSSATADVKGQVPPEDTIPGNKVTVAPNPRYAAGPLHRWILGTEYRDIWGIPVEIEVMDIKTFAGGLTPIKRRGFGQRTAWGRR